MVICANCAIMLGMSDSNSISGTTGIWNTLTTNMLLILSYHDGMMQHRYQMQLKMSFMVYCTIFINSLVMHHSQFG